MRTSVVVAAIGASLVAGCGGGEPEPRLGEGPDAPPGGGPAPGQSADERVIRGWSQAVNLGEYGRAAGYFARGAIVEQVGVARLATREEAIDFNSSLPCRADVTDVDEGKDSTLAAFRLREGREGECADGGSARVRFVIRGGKIREWRQLPPPEEDPGAMAVAAGRLL